MKKLWFQRLVWFGFPGSKYIFIIQDFHEKAHQLSINLEASDLNESRRRLQEKATEHSFINPNIWKLRYEAILNCSHFWGYINTKLEMSERMWIFKNKI